MGQIDNNLHETVKNVHVNMVVLTTKLKKKVQTSDHRKSPLFRFSVCNTQMYQSLIQTAEGLGHSYESI